MATPATTDPAIGQQLARACEELERRLRAGEPGGAAELLEEFPELARDRGAVLELIYTEFVLREERGERPVPEDWYARFPAWEADLRELFQVDSHVRGQAVDVPTVAGAGPTVMFGPAARPVRGRLAGDYELLEELGRGGMGVVYKARQVSLNRIVALKMIPGGQHADPRVITRFRREAEAVARLQHPNIVQIHEVGELDGIPFFAMEFVEGGTLAHELTDAPLPVRAAAALIEGLARAVEYAHRHGIVHRDLKPANILLSVSGETRDAGPGSAPPPVSRLLCPKITDFGLAKLLASEGAPTESGAVLGTPGYMAPEQACGDAKRVGPEADVYSLGAILYECLAGRPPVTSSGWQALTDALDATPVAPSRLRPGVPRDLETVCLKCLEKDPARRYRTALALADDLARFLNDQTVRARPPGVLYQFGKFARRNRVAVAGAVGVFLALVAGLIGTGVMLGRAKTAEREAHARLAESYAHAGELALQRGACQAAVEYLDKALAKGHPEPVRLGLLKVRALRTLHRVPEALAELRNLAGRPDLGDREGEVLLWQADIALAQKTDEAGLDLVRRSLRFPLAPADESYARGLLAGTVPAAVDHFRQALRHDPFHHRANAMVATLHILQGEMADARSRAEFAARLFPEDPTFAILGTVAHALEEGAAADAVVERRQPQLGEKPFAAVRAFLALARAGRALEEPLAAIDEPIRQELAIQAYLAASAKAMRELEALRAAGPDVSTGNLFLPVPPVFTQAMANTATALNNRTKAPIEALRRASEVYPDGLNLFFLGIELANVGRSAEAAEALRAAIERPSFIQVRRPALYALTAVEWDLGKEGRFSLARCRWKAASVASARRLLGYDRLHAHEAQLVAAAADSAGNWTLGRTVAERWAQQGGEEDRTLLQFLMKVEYETGSYRAAVDAADRILAKWPNDMAAVRYRAAAVIGLRGQLDALTPTMRKP
jgi:tetratricopeptide (TPR) repeat protein